MPYIYFYIAIALLFGFVSGILLGKRLTPKHIKKAKESQIAFLTGFRYMLSNEPDRAIESFMRAVRFDTDTIETYFALANLFRDKGEIERAIRIHQSIITRPHLDANIRLQALYDLALDYKKGGFLDRAINTFREVIRRAPHKKEAYLELAEVYQTLKDWEAAFKVIEKLAKIFKEDYSLMLAHFQTEMGKKLQAEGEKDKAEDHYKKAIKINEKCVDAYLHLGDLYFERGDVKKAIKTWTKAISVSPEYSFLAFGRLEKYLSEIKGQKVFRKFISELEKAPEHNIFAAIFLARYYLSEKKLNGARECLLAALEKTPSHIVAQQLLAQTYLEEGNTEKAIEVLEQISKEAFPQNIYQCTYCGYEATELSWKCPQCQKWDTMQPKI